MTHDQLGWIANYIWGIADDVLRDLYVRGKYRDVILPMTVLRRLDAVLEPTKQAVLERKARFDEAGIVNQDAGLRAAAGQAFYNASPFTMQDLKARASQQQLRADFEAYLDGFSPNVQEIVDNFEFRNQVPRLSKADALGSLIEKLASPDVNLGPDPVLKPDGTVKHPGLDNHGMGTIFEELVRRFNEENNEEAGEHWTPRDAVQLMAKLVFLPVADDIAPGTYLLYDGACGTGGMLTVAEETLQALAQERGKQVATHLYGQEINAETYAICKADLLLKGEGEAADNIVGGPEHSTLSNDAFPDKEFDFMLSNPPYGKSWKSDLQRMGGKRDMHDPRFSIQHGSEPDFSLATRVSDGQMLFLANMLSKMKRDTPMGSRIAEVQQSDERADAGVGEDGEDAKRRPFHSYTMKQAVQEGFILDVLQHYTPVRSYYRLVKKVADDPVFDAKRAAKKLRRYVEGHDHAVRLKAEIMADHFHNQVLAQRKIGGQARAMVVTDGVERAIQYYDAIQAYLAKQKRGYKVLVAFSGEREHGGATVSEASLNGFAESQTAANFREDPYRILVCADKFQTGYDEPLLHTMYVDKMLSGVRAVQTLSRLNRACRTKHDVAVLDFMNDEDAIKAAFEPYYQTTILSGETDPDKLHDLQSVLDGHQVYDTESVDEFTRLYLDEADRERLDPILDACVDTYVNDLDEDGQVEFKSKAKTFLRTYGFLSSVLPWAYPPWEKRSIFLHFLVPRLPAPREEDLSRGVLEAIDMDSYRVEKQAVRTIRMTEGEDEIDPVPFGGASHAREPELDQLSAIVEQFNDRWGGEGEWRDQDRVRRLITNDLPTAVGADESFRNAQQHSDGQNVRIEHDNALKRAVNGTIEDDMQFYKRFSDDESFRRWVAESVFRLVSSE